MMGKMVHAPAATDYSRTPLTPWNGVDRLKGYLRCAQWKLANFRKPKEFLCDGTRYSYFAHGYNRTWNNERAVELPLIGKFVRENRGRRILEVGNVLPHYFKTNHDVLDKYEIGRGIIRKDIVEFQPAQPYDLIISISTLEHVGWDETPREPEKVIHALQHVKSLLAPGANLVMTFPLGYNPVLDEHLFSNLAGFGAVSFLQRTSADPRWMQVDAVTAAKCAYGRPFPFANAIAFSVFRKGKVSA